MRGQPPTRFEYFEAGEPTDKVTQSHSFLQTNFKDVKRHEKKEFFAYAMDDYKKNRKDQYG